MSEADARFESEAVRRYYTGLLGVYDARANEVCARAYEELVRGTFGSCRRVLEIGTGATTLLPGLPATARVALDLCPSLLRAQKGQIRWWRVAGDAQALPFADGSFDGIYAINVIEHIPDPHRLLGQVSRLLDRGGRFLAVTPNGDLEPLLDLLERLHMKIPEGPHRFLRFEELARLGGEPLRALEHRRFLAFPMGPRPFVRLIDRVLAGSSGRGLFQYIVVEKGGAAPSTGR